MADSAHKPSEYDPAPGKPTSAADRAALSAREAARASGGPVPPIARPYDGWDGKRG